MENFMVLLYEALMAALVGLMQGSRTETILAVEVSGRLPSYRRPRRPCRRINASLLHGVATAAYPAATHAAKMIESLYQGTAFRRVFSLDTVVLRVSV